MNKLAIAILKDCMTALLLKAKLSNIAVSMALCFNFMKNEEVILC